MQFFHCFRSIVVKLTGHTLYIFVWIRTHDTGCSFEPIFMKFTWLVRVHSWMNPFIFGNNLPHKNTDIGKICTETIFSGLSQTVWGFLGKKLNNCIRYCISKKKKDYIHFCCPKPYSLKKGHTPTSKKKFFAVILKSYIFFKKLVEWKIFKTSMPTKQVILIFFTRHYPTLKTVMSSHKWVFCGFLQKYSFFEKLVF